MFQRMIDKSMAKSPWIFHINAGSCNGCDIELVSVLTPRYDAERLGFRLTGTPRQADIVVVSGSVRISGLDSEASSLEIRIPLRDFDPDAYPYRRGYIIIRNIPVSQ